MLRLAKLTQPLGVQLLQGAPRATCGRATQTASSLQEPPTPEEAAAQAEVKGRLDMDPLAAEYDRTDEALAQMEEERLAAREAAMERLGRPVDLELEYDMDDPEGVDTAELYAPPPPPMEPLGRPVDLELEYDMDDPEAVDPAELYAPPRPREPLSEVDLDAELDLMQNGTRQAERLRRD